MDSSEDIDKLLAGEEWNIFDVINSSQQKANQERRKKEKKQQLDGLEENITKRDEARKRRLEDENKRREESGKKINNKAKSQEAKKVDSKPRTQGKQDRVKEILDGLEEFDRMQAKIEEQQAQANAERNKNILAQLDSIDRKQKQRKQEKQKVDSRFVQNSAELKRVDSEFSGQKDDDEILAKIKKFDGELDANNQEKNENDQANFISLNLDEVGQMIDEERKEEEERSLVNEISLNIEEQANEMEEKERQRLKKKKSDQISENVQKAVMEEEDAQIAKEIGDRVSAILDKKKQEEQERRTAEMAEEISRNMEKIIAKQEKEIKKEMKKEKKKAKRKIHLSKDILIDRKKYPRFTAPKKRNIISRLILQYSYKNEKNEDLVEGYLEEKDYLEEEGYLDEEGHLTNVREKFYKEVQEYEDMVDDAEIRSGWRKFKIGLATAALAATSLLAVHLTTNAKANEKITNPTTIEASVNDDEDYISEKDATMAEKSLENIKNDSGFEMTEFTEEEQIEAVVKIKEAEKSLTLSRAKYYFTSVSDQEYIESFAKEAFGDEYEEFTDEQKYELTKLAYELITDEEIKSYMRDPENVKNSKEALEQKLSESEESGSER